MASSTANEKITEATNEKTTEATNEKTTEATNEKTTEGTTEVSEKWSKIRKLNSELSKPNKDCIKLAATVVLNVAKDLPNEASLLQIYQKMEEANENKKKAPIYLYKMLQVLNSRMATRLVDELVIKIEPTDEDEALVNILKPAKYVTEMNENDYEQFKRCAAKILRVHHTNIESRCDLVKMLYDKNKLHTTRVQIMLHFYRFLKQVIQLAAVLTIITAALIMTVFVLVKATSHSSYIKPNEYSATTGSNTTVLLKEKCLINCTDNLESVVITRGPSKADTTIYLADEVLLSTPVTLPPRKPRQYPLEGKNNFGINYYLNDPIHTAGPGIITYTINTTITDDDNTTECPLEFYLFNSNYTYHEFLRNTNRPDYIDCFSPCNETNSSFESIQTFSFKCPRSGFYFVGVSLENGVSVDATISAELKAFQHPPNNFSKCHLSPTDKENCTFPVNSPYSKVCLYAVSKDTFIQNVTIAFNCKYVECSQFPSAYWVMVVLIILSIIIVLFCVCKCACALIKRGREKKLESEKTPLIEKPDSFVEQ